MNIAVLRIELSASLNVGSFRSLSSTNAEVFVVRSTAVHGHPVPTVNNAYAVGAPALEAQMPGAFGPEPAFEDALIGPETNQLSPDSSISRHRSRGGIRPTRLAIVGFAIKGFIKDCPYTWDVHWCRALTHG